MFILYFITIDTCLVPKPEGGTGDPDPVPAKSQVAIGFLKNLVRTSFEKQNQCCCSRFLLRHRQTTRLIDLLIPSIPFYSFICGSKYELKISTKTV